MKKIRIFLYILLFIILLLLAGGLFFSLTLKDNAIFLIKKYSDENLITEIEVSKFDFSLYRKFPNATIILQDVYAKSSLNFHSEEFKMNTDTLLYARSVFFEFNLLSILRNEYILKNIQFNNGKLNIYTDQQGNNNYEIWLKKEKKEKAEFIIDLKKLNFKDFKFHIHNLEQKYHFRGNSDKIAASGNFSESKYSMVLKGDLMINESPFPEIRTFKNIKLDFNINSLIRNNNYYLKYGILNIDNKIPLKITGSIIKNKTAGFILNAYSDKIKLQDILPYLPENMRFEEKLKTSGQLELRSKISGKISGGTNPVVICEFQVNNGSLYFKKNNLMIKDICLNGSYHSGSSQLLIHKFKGNTQKSSFTGNYKLIDFKSPDHELNLDGKFFLPELTQIVSIPGVIINKGFASGNIQISGTGLKFNEISTKDIPGLRKKADLMIENAEIIPTGPDLPVTDINGKITIHECIDLNDFSFHIYDDLYSVNLTVSGLFKYIFSENSFADIKGNITADHIDYRKYIQNTSGNKNENGYMSYFPDNFKADITLNTGSLILPAFLCENLDCKILYNPGTIDIRSFSCDLMEGSVKGTVMLKKKPDHSIVFTNRSSLNHINISKLFLSFDNFRQDYITHEHLKGYVKGDIILNSSLDTIFRIKKETADCKGNITISNGELINFTPMLGLSSYFKEEQLKHIRFKTFNSTITIKDEIVDIAETSIHSSLINISGNGLHNFNNEYIYYLNVNLSDFLFKRFKKNASKEQEWLIKEDSNNRLPHPLIIKGKGEIYTAEINKKKWFSNFKNRLNEERQIIKSIIKNDPGQQNTTNNIIFKHDSLNLNDNRTNNTNIIQSDDQNEEEIIYEWND